MRTFVNLGQSKFELSSARGKIGVGNGPNWQEANQLAIYKRKVELGTTEKQI